MTAHDRNRRQAYHPLGAFLRQTRLDEIRK
jgi:lipopolysaccharide/colanic/teichoic acid biosynthesis glycosyltransferase